MRFLQLSVLAVAAALIVACTRPSQLAEKAGTNANPEARIQQIPSADPQKYAGMRNMKEWRNPYLIIRPDGVVLLDVANREEHLLKPDELPQALAKLPPSAWPYGRVVAAAESNVKVSGDDVLIRKNRGIVAGTLESMHVLINWVPST